MAEQSLSESTHAFQQARADRLSAALTQALASKVPADPQGSPGSVKSEPKSSAEHGSNSAKPEKPSAPSSNPDTTDQASETSSAAPHGATDSESSEESPSSESDDSSATEAPHIVDRDAVSAAAKKKDWRQVEKLCGLEEGTLGAGNADYAAYRRRCDELAGHERTLVEKFGPTVQLIQSAGRGDLAGYGRLIEVTTGVPIQVFIEHWAKNSPRIDTSQLQRQAPAQQQPAADEKPSAAATQETAITKANGYLTGELKSHPALKLKGGLDDVRKVWLESYNPKTRGFGLTPQQAAERVVTERRKSIEQEQWLLSGKKPATRPRTKTITREGSSETQPRKQDLTREQLIEIHAQKWRRDRARENAK